MSFTQTNDKSTAMCVAVVNETQSASTLSKPTTSKRKNVTFDDSCKTFDGFSPLQISMRKVLCSTRFNNNFDAVEVLHEQWKCSTMLQKISFITRLIEKLIKFMLRLNIARTLQLVAEAGSHYTHIMRHSSHSLERPSIRMVSGITIPFRCKHDMHRINHRIAILRHLRDSFLSQS